jgi:hypothetical protein
MCIFSQSVRRVSQTNIFARVVGEKQFLVYEMSLASETDVAMILPLPARSGDDSVSFINLSRYSSFFSDMDRCFPRPMSRSQTLSVAAGARETLIVYRVGAFDASFVPKRSEFDRLDPRFRLRQDLWSALPQYADYGFAVFQLRAGDAHIHPMALSFLSADPALLYFPTVHIHDNAVHETAEFDHALFAQAVADTPEWHNSPILPREVMDFGNLVVSDRTRGTVNPTLPIARRIIRGISTNADTWVAVRHNGGTPANFNSADSTDS